MLGERLKQAIEQSGKSITQAASFIGVSEGNLYKMFKKDSFELTYIRKAAKFTGHSINYFLEEDFNEANSQILQNSHIGENVSTTFMESTLKQIEQNLESRYEKIISHYEVLLKRYETQANPFKVPASGAKIVEMRSKKIAG